VSPEVKEMLVIWFGSKGTVYQQYSEGNKRVMAVITPHTPLICPLMTALFAECP
jgi:hypothetical protein